MNSEIINGKLFLGGGGDKNASMLIDELFVNQFIERRLKKIIYIPIALTSRPYSECLKWFTSVFAEKIPKIEMWEHLKGKILLGLENSSAVYIGGGNTVRLLKLFRESRFDSQIKRFFSKGGLIYGGSAGAIILGKDIRTAPEARDLKLANGLALLFPFAIACHFVVENTPNLINLSGKIKTKILAIEENAGVIFDSREISPIGPGKTYIISTDGKRILNKILNIEGQKNAS